MDDNVVVVMDGRTFTVSKALYENLLSEQWEAIKAHTRRSALIREVPDGE